MKKKKLFLGLALSLGLFALASCNTTNNPSQSSSTTPAEATTGQSGTQGASTQGEATSGEQTSGGAESSQAVQKFTITYNANGHGTAPAALADVAAYPETLPTLTEEGYQFMGWATTATAIEANVTAGAAITDDVTLYAVWVERPTYASISAKDGVILTTKFDEAESVIKNTYQGYNPGMTGFYVSSFPKSGVDDSGNAYTTEGCSVTVAGGKAVATDGSTTATTALTAELGFIYEGVVEGTMKYTPTQTEDKTNSGWSMVQFLGYQSFSEDASTLFSLRTNGDKKLQLHFKYKVNDTDTSASDVFKGTAFAYTPGTEYEIYWKYDFATSSITIRIDNTVIVENEVLPEALRPVFFAGVKFITAESDTKRGFKLTDFAVAQTSTMTLDEVKAYMTSILDESVAAIDMSLYTFIASDIQTGVQATKAAITAATSKDEAFGAVMEGMMSLFDSQYFLTDAQYKEKVIQEAQYAKSQMSQNYTVNADAFNAAFDTCIATITAATTKAEVDGAKTTLVNTVNAIDSDAKIRGVAMTEYTTYYGAKTDELTALYQESTIDATKLAAATAELTAISTEYIGTEDNPGTLMICSMDTLDAKLAEAKGELDKVVNKYSFSLEDYEATLVTAFNTYKATQLEASGFDEQADGTLYSGVNSLTIDFTSVTDSDEADQALVEAKAQADAVIALYAYKYNSTDGIEKQFYDYVTSKVATLKISQATYEADYKDLMDGVVDDFDTALFAAISTTASDGVLTAYEETVDNLIADIKAATEVIVTFKNGDTTVDTADVLVGGKATRPAEDPTQDGYVFKGWFAEEACTTAFDFDNTTITTATTIYAGWYDKITPTTTSIIFDNTYSTSPTSSSPLNVKDSSNIIQVYSNNSSDKWDTSYSGLKFNGATKNSRYIKIVATQTTTITFVGTGGGNARHIELASNYGSASTIESATCKPLPKASDAAQTTLTFNVNAGTYYLNASGSIYITSLSASVGIEATITGITADAQANAGSIAVSNVKLFDNATAPNEIAITTGYTVEVRNSADQVVENSGLTDGETYTVIVKFGSYTKYTTTVTMPAVA